MQNVGKIKVVLARALPRCLRILFRNQSYRSSAHDFLFVFVFFSWAELTLTLLHKGSPRMQWSGDNGALKKGEKEREFECFEEIPKARETRVTLWFVFFRSWELTPERNPKAREVQALERSLKQGTFKLPFPF